MRQELLVAVMALGLAGAGCRAGNREIASMPKLPAAQVIELHSATLMAIPGVVGVYEGVSRGDTVIRVMLATNADSTRRKLPRVLEGYRVEPEVTGPIEPMKK